MKMAVMTCARCERENDDSSGAFTFMINATDFERRYPSYSLNRQFEIPDYEFICPHCGSGDYTKQIGEVEVEWERDAK